MKELMIHQDKINSDVIKALQAICPFNAIEQEGDQMIITAACKMCGICARKGPKGAVTLTEKSQAGIDKSEWRGIAVFADLSEGYVHPVTFELIGKARELADQIKHPVYAFLAGSNLRAAAEQLINDGVDEVFIYEHPKLATFLIEPYAAAAEDFIRKVQPAAMLIGATNAGRSLAPRIAARFKTGLTADCTALEIKPDTDLIQIRPAFGGNIMARIVTPQNRPQLCTVRYKIFNAPVNSIRKNGKITHMQIEDSKLQSRVALLQTRLKDSGIDISAAEVVIAVGRGVKSKKDLANIQELANHIQAKMACTRPLVENGWFDPRLQIGLSGRTVSPKLIITAGISGSVQFVSGMRNSDTIIAINNDPQAAIFNVAHHAFIGDLYEIMPQVINLIHDQHQRASCFS